MQFVERFQARLSKLATLYLDSFLEIEHVCSYLHRLFLGALRLAYVQESTVSIVVLVLRKFVRQTNHSLLFLSLRIKLRHFRFLASKSPVRLLNFILSQLLPIGILNVRPEHTHISLSLLYERIL